MTLPTDKSTITLNGDGSNKNFDFDFRVWETSQLQVWVSVDGATAEEKTSGWSAVLNADQDANPGGTVTYPSSGDALTASDTLTVIRDMPFVQGVDLVDNQAFSPEVIEAAMDKATAERQQLKEELNRTAKVVPGESVGQYLEDSATNAEAAAASASAAATSETNAAASESAAAAAAAAVVRNVHNETATAAQTTVTTSFTLASTLDDIMVFVDGVQQHKDTLTRTSDTVIALGGALTGGEEIEVRSASFSPDAESQAAASAASAAASAAAAAANVTAYDVVTDLETDVAAAGSTRKTLVVADTQTLSANLTVPSNIDLRQVGAGVIATGSYTLTINGGIDCSLRQFFDTSGGGALGGTPLIDSVLPEWFGDTTGADASAPIQEAISFAREIRDDSGVASFTVEFKRPVYNITTGLKFVKGLRVKGDRNSTLIIQTGSQPAMYSATYTSGVYVDNLDASLGDAAGAKEVNNASIDSIHFSHEGTISGNSPDSATPFTAVVQLVGAYGGLFDNIRISSQTNNMHGLHLKYCWQAKVENFYASRGGAYSGGAALFLDSECNAVLVDHPYAYGAWGEGLRSTNPYSVTVLEPNMENCILGIYMAGVKPRILGGYFEGNTTHIRLGTAGATLAQGAVVQVPYLNAGSSASEYGIDLAAAKGCIIDVDKFTGTYATSPFRVRGAGENFGNTIRIRVDDAANPGLAALGLENNGRNVVKASGDLYGDHRAFKKYSTETNEELETELNQRGAQFVSFSIQIRNNAGTLESRIVDGGNDPATFNGCFVTSASTYATMGDVSSVVDFGTSGAGGLGGNNQLVILNTGDQATSEQAYAASAVVTTCGTALTAEARQISRDINGVTKTRAELYFRDAATGADFAVNTTNLASGQYVKVHVLGFIR